MQTVFTFPHFLSWVIVASIMTNLLSVDGLVNTALKAVGASSINFLGSEKMFQPMLYITDIWKSAGYSSIIYLSAISGIDQDQYEAAEIDGATRLQKIWFVTLPFMLPLIVIQLIFAVGGMLSSNTDMVLLLYNSAVYSTADVIGTYVYRESLLGAKYSYGTASGLILSVMSFILVYAANWVSRRLTDFSLW